MIEDRKPLMSVAELAKGVVYTEVRCRSFPALSLVLRLFDVPCCLSSPW